MLYFDRIAIFEAVNVNKKANQKSAIYFTIVIFYINALNFTEMSTIDTIIY